MVFRSKVDTFFINFMIIIVIILAVASFFPLFMEGGTQLPVVLTMTSLFLVFVSFILWTAFSVKYVFCEDYLYVKGGPFRSSIRYENITMVKSSHDVFTGYRILSSRDGIEIFYKTAILGSVKISPKEQRKFITELHKRCPDLKIQV